MVRSWPRPGYVPERGDCILIPVPDKGIQALCLVERINKENPGEFFCELGKMTFNPETMCHVPNLEQLTRMIDGNYQRQMEMAVDVVRGLLYIGAAINFNCPFAVWAAFVRWKLDRLVWTGKEWTADPAACTLVDRPIINCAAR